MGPVATVSFSSYNHSSKLTTLQQASVIDIILFVLRIEK